MQKTQSFAPKNDAYKSRVEALKERIDAKKIESYARENIADYLPLFCYCFVDEKFDETFDETCTLKTLQIINTALHGEPSAPAKFSGAAFKK